MIGMMLEIVDQNLTLFGVAFFALLMVSMEIGYQVGVFIKHKGWFHEKPQMSGSFVITGMLTLLAFFLGITLSIANNEYRERQAAILAEANAIGTAHLIAGAQANSNGAGIQRLLETYIKVRISAVKNAQTPEDKLQIVKRTGALQNEIWAKASDIAKRTEDRVSALLLTALTETFDNSVLQRVAFDKRIPTHLSRLLLLTAMLTLVAAGVNFGLLGDRMLMMTILLLLIFTGAVILIADISRPHQGNIRVSPEPLIWTLNSIKPAP